MSRGLWAAIAMVAASLLTDATGRCRWIGHDWRTINAPEPQYPGVAIFAGTKRCRRCDRFSYWTARETAQYEAETPWKSW